MYESTPRSNQCCPPSVMVGRKRIGQGQPLYVVAEAGVNHNGDATLARDLIHAAKNAGADAVKFQVFSAKRLVAADAAMCEYQRAHSGCEKGFSHQQHVSHQQISHQQEQFSHQPLSNQHSQYEMLRKLELAPDEWLGFKQLADELGIDFLATPFGLPDLRALIGLAPPAIKIASPDIVNIPLLSSAAATNLPLIVSTGAATLDEVDHAVRLIRRHRHEERLILMHCVSAYPTEARDARLACIQTLASRHRVPVGFSDHTADSRFSAVAVAAGAVILEKHLTLSRTSDGPDHFFSLEPDDFGQYVETAHAVRRMLGDGEVGPSEPEQEVRRLARGSIIAQRPIRAGQVLGADDLAVQRPAGGIEPTHWSEVLGRIATTDISANTRLDWSMLS